jgi:type I restriction enzyme, S subunit
MDYKKTDIGTIPHHWKIKKLGELGLIKGRIGWRGYTVDDLTESGPYVLGAGDITSENKIELSKAKHINLQKYIESPEIILEKGDSLIVKVGSTIGKVGFFNFDNIEATINPNSVIFRARDVDPYYIYYYLCTRFAKNFLISNSPASAQAAINQSTIKLMPVAIPTIDEQKSIGKILSSLDDKIELNNKINKTLKELAQTLYKHWFVDFEFPNEEGKPYKSSGGEMVESELGMIPKGWVVSPINDNEYCTSAKPGIDSFSREKIYIATADVKDTKITNLNTKITLTDRPSRANMQPKQNSIWFAKMKDSRKLIRFGVSSYFENKLVISTGFAGVVCSFGLDYFWTFLQSTEFDNAKNNLSNGTTMEAINNSGISLIKLVIPDKKTLSTFSATATPLYEMIELNNLQNNKLAEATDLLLPKLMSGEIEV